jgi:diguanylate cyclase (GGDEF)-like protein
MATNGSSPVNQAENVERIGRMGKRLLRVANCTVTFGENSGRQNNVERSLATIEAAFLASIPLSDRMELVADTRSDPSYSSHRQVVGAPYIRFYASYPIKRKDEVVGNVRLIDYAPHVFGSEEEQILADLAALVEREFLLDAVRAAYIGLEKKNRSLRRDSMIDPLIGTWNRTAIIRLLKQETEQCKKEGKPLSLVFADIDSFKKINEKHGRNEGDRILMKMASRLRSCIHPGDTLGRYEGEKFMIIMPGASHAVAKAIAQRLQTVIMSHAEPVGNETVNLTISSGTVSTDMFPDAAIDELVFRVDSALQAAKNAGRNCVIQAVPS